jgi:FG-GAP-like repeat/Secretion system C-terminal sorting domain
MRLCTLFLLFTLSITTRAQFTYLLDQSIPVEVNGKTLVLPWAGGLNGAQVNTMDLNGDNKQDLVIFDRTANKIITFLSTSGSYTYAPDFEKLFPSEVTQWVLFRDFNCDGKKDIFTSDPFGIVVFVNTTKPGQKLSWRPFNPGFPLLTKGFSGNVNLKVNDSDLPAIDDVDGDGDLDILNVRFVGSGTVEWHKNLSIERTGKCDSLQLERITQNYGGFEECQCGKFAFGQTCASLPGGRTQHAGGKALLTIDLDNDGDRELLFSEESCARVYMLENIGTAQNAVMTSAVVFPSPNPINFLIFPAPYLEDLDFDGKMDLIASPNIPTRNNFYNNFRESMWFYKNTGTSQVPQFTFNKTNFLQEEMIEIGDNAVPAFIDADGDGDQDMFISMYVGSNLSSTVYYYENTGDSEFAKFKLVTTDFNNLSFINLYNLKLQFADMNGDGTIDFVFTGTSPQNGGTVLYFFANRSANWLDLSGQSIQSTDFQIGQTENILVVDVNQDGLNDILLGKTTGAVQYWKNIGPAAQFNFSLETGSFLGLGTSTDRQSPAFAAADLDADGRGDLVLGNQRGELSIYGDFRAQNPAINGVTDIIYNSLTEEYYSKNLGGRIWPAVVNLFNSDKPSIVVGNTLGGIHILKNEASKTLPEEPVVDLFPNPVERNETMNIKTDRNMTVEFFTSLGQKLSQSYFIPANQEYPVILSGLSSGIYLARFSYNGNTLSKRFVIY